jgi:hypothetical protein
MNIQKKHDDILIHLATASLCHYQDDGTRDGAAFPSFPGLCREVQ